jgi:hypothetical protein
MLNSLDRDSYDSCRVWLGLVKKRKSTDYKYVSWVNNKDRIIHQQLSAHRLPCSRVFLGKCHATPITLCVIRAVSPLLVYFGVSRSEA